jgi:ABC-2 type transport system ATP-binding protein
MDIEIENLTKKYGNQKAVDNISLNVPTGEILGFLGPNGAGKTSTMKIITSYIASDEGEVYIGGMSIRDNPDEIKRHIGYLPENNLLYPDMPEIDYLNFCSSLHSDHRG